MPTYTGPLRNEPLAIELHNTLYADRGEPRDGLADAVGLRAWLHAVSTRLPVDPRAVDVDRRDDLLDLRAATREALHATVDRHAIPDVALAALNRFSAGSPRSLGLAQRGRRPVSELRHHGPTATDVVLGALASDAIELVGGPHAADLRACEAPGCVLFFLKDHPRREWCSAACGNRARQARHYARRRRKAAP